MITINELFSGIGSQVAALRRIGVPYNVIGIAEIDKYAIQSYEAINGPTRNYGDISAVESLDYADLWTYSFPCQDLSVAGKQKGIKEGTRSGLLLEVERLLLNAVKDGSAPKYLLLENVKNLVGKQFKPDFDKWLDTLDFLGYDNYWQVLNAKDYGIPQNRERVFVVSIRKDLKQSYKFPDKTELLFRLKDLLEPAADEKYYLKGEKIERLLNNFTGLQIREYCDMSVNEPKIKSVANCILARYDKGVSNHKNVGTAVIEPICVASRGRNPENTSDRTTGSPTEQRLEAKFDGCTNTLTTVQKDNYVLQMVGLLDIKGNEQVRRVYDEDGLAPTLNTMQGGNRQPKILQHPHGFNKGNVFENCPTITANGSFEQNNFLLHNLQIRKLTPLECWRLMGFTDEDFYKARGKFLKTKTLPEYDEDDEGERIVVGFKERKVYEMSDNQLYKQAGNSIVVNVLAFIFRNLFNAPRN